MGHGLIQDLVLVMTDDQRPRHIVAVVWQIAQQDLGEPRRMGDDSGLAECLRTLVD